MSVKQRGIPCRSSALSFAVIIAMLTGGCSTRSVPGLIPVGPNVTASVVVVFDAGASDEDVRQFVVGYLSQPSLPQAGGIREIASDVLRIAPFQNTYAPYMGGITFCPTAPEERRQAVVAVLASAPRVAKVARNIAPLQVVP
jgi:hypothetical protein